MNGAAIVYHKHPASARTRFVKFSHGSVVGSQPQPTLTTLTEPSVRSNQQAAEAVIAEIQQLFGLQREELCVNEEFCAAVETPGEHKPVFLLKLETLDPPFESVESTGAKFIALTEARGLPDFELLLLQQAYKAIMEG